MDNIKKAIVGFVLIVVILVCIIVCLFIGLLIGTFLWFCLTSVIVTFDILFHMNHDGIVSWSIDLIFLVGKVCYFLGLVLGLVWGYTQIEDIN